MVPSLSSIVEDLFWKVPVFFTDGCSASSCDFGALVRGGELRCFLLRHLGQSRNFVMLSQHLSRAISQAVKYSHAQSSGPEPELIRES